jgi:hypothetical protein
MQVNVPFRWPLDVVLLARTEKTGIGVTIGNSLSLPSWSLALVMAVFRLAESASAEPIGRQAGDAVRLPLLRCAQMISKSSMQLAT